MNVTLNLFSFQNLPPKGDAGFPGDRGRPGTSGIAVSLRPSFGFTRRGSVVRKDHGRSTASSHISPLTSAFLISSSPFCALKPAL